MNEITREEIERAIKNVELGNNMLLEYDKDTVLSALRSELAREKNEPLTCEGCKTWGIAQKHPFQIKRCSECSRQNGRADRYEPKEEPHV